MSAMGRKLTAREVNNRRLKRRLRIAALALCLAIDAVATQQSEELSLVVSGDRYSFTPITEQYLGHSYYGAYTHPYAFTGGTVLHLFPDGRFTVIDACDICADRLTAKGTYRLRDGLITLDYAATSEARPVPDTLRAFHGVIHKPTYITGSQFILISQKNLDAAKRNANFSEYLLQRTGYPDWQAIYNKQVEAKPDGPAR